MQEPLWIDRYRPDISDFPQESVKRNLRIACDSDMNLMISGPKGIGKTAAALAVGNKIHQNPENDIQVVNVTDVFDRTKKELSGDPRFSNILSGSSRTSKRDMINKVISEIASYPPVTGGFKTLILDNAEKSREDFQQSLRRTIERNSSSTQFVFTTRNPSKLIDPIQSRCYPVQIRTPTNEEVVKIVDRIERDENIDLNRDGIDYIWSQTSPNLREFLVSLQTVYQDADEIDPKSSSEVMNEVSSSDEILEILELSKDQEYKDVKSNIKDLIQKEGYSEDMVLKMIVDEAVNNLREDESAEICRRASKADKNIQESVDGVVPIVDMLSSWSES